MTGDPAGSFWTSNPAKWRWACWLFRCLIVAGAFAAWELAAQSRYVPAAVWAFVALAAIPLQWSAKRHALGWVIDETGERQKVEAIRGGKALYTPTSRQMREIEEVSVSVWRRTHLARFGALALVLAGIAYAAYDNLEALNRGSLLGAIGIGFGGLAAFFGAVILLLVLILVAEELLYQCGFQDMKGAKVLDAPPHRPGLREVAAQKAHGDARLAGEHEAQNILNPRRR